jgi:hypothetical protein
MPGDLSPDRICLKCNESTKAGKDVNQISFGRKLERDEPLSLGNIEPIAITN